MSHIRFTHLLLCSTAIISTPVMADASLDELKAKFEQAQKENIILKTEKIERENIAMKLEQIQAENAALRNEAKVDKAPTASIHSQKTAAVPANPPSPEAKTIARREPVEVSVPTPREHVAARREINHALDNMPKDDTRREMTAAYKAPKDEVPIVVKQWQGIYAGITAGYAANDIETYSTTVGFAPGTSGYNSINAEPIVGGSTNSQYFAGPVVGGTVGYNHQFLNNFILGAETDLMWSDINNNHITNTNNWSYVITPSIRSINSTNGRIGLDWLGTTRARFGYSLGSFMPYVTGGLAYGNLSASGSVANIFGYGSNGSGFRNDFGTTAGSNYSSVKLGWAAGAGAEYRVASNWSVKGEYLYTQISGLNGPTNGSGSSNYYCSGCTLTNAISSGPIFSKATMGAFGIHQARVGLNYHTGWLGGGTPAVTAKY